MPFAHYLFSCVALVSFLCPPPATAQPPAGPQTAALQGRLDALARRARPGIFGIEVLDLRTGSRWNVNASRAYPLMSVFKAPVTAAVLAKVDAGRLRMDQPVTLTRAEVQEGSAVPSVGALFKGERMTFTVGQLMVAAVSQSDNTAVNALIRLVGGPQVVTDFLHAHGIAGMRVDKDEVGIERVFDNLGGAAAPPAGEPPAAEKRRFEGGYRAFLADPSNRGTPDAAVAFLQRLVQGELLSAASTRYLLGLMEAQTVPSRLRGGLPAGVRLTDKTGTSGTIEGKTAAYNDMGILTRPDGHTVIVAAFLSESVAARAERDRLFADLARTVVAETSP